MVRSCVNTWLMSISLMSSFPSCHPDQSRISRVEAFGKIDALFAHARELVTQRAFADTQFFSGIISTAFAGAQRFDDDHIARAENEGALHHVVELAHVARPAMRQQPLLRLEAQHRRLHLAVAP